MSPLKYGLRISKKRHQMNAIKFLCQLNIFDKPKPPNIKGMRGTIIPKTVNKIRIIIDTSAIFQAINNDAGGKIKSAKKKDL